MKAYTHIQTLPIKTLRINHNLYDTNLMVQFFDKDNNLELGHCMVIRYDRGPKNGPDPNHIIIDFDVEWLGGTMVLISS